MSRLIRYKNFARYMIYKYILPAYGLCVCTLFFFRVLQGHHRKRVFSECYGNSLESMRMTLLNTSSNKGYGDWSGYHLGKASSGWTGTPAQPQTLQTIACLACLGGRSSELVRVARQWDWFNLRPMSGEGAHGQHSLGGQVPEAGYPRVPG